MVTVSDREDVYVDIRALNGCDTDHLTAPFLLMEKVLFLKMGSQQDF